MNICFINSGFERHGGIERVVSILVGELANRKNLHIFSVSLYSGGGTLVYPISEAVRMDALFPHPLNMRKALLKGAVSKLKKYLWEHRIDVVVACGILYYPLACAAGKKAGAKVICWEHTNPAVTCDFRFAGISRKYGAKRSDVNVLISEAGLSYYRRHFPKAKNVLIHNPADTALFEGTTAYNPDNRKLISVGRITYAKNYPLLIDIAARVLPHHEGWTWDIYGDGNTRAELEEKISALNLEGRVILKGNVADIYDRYPQYSALVLTSRYEGFPMVLIEGAAKGLPLVSFDIETGPREIIENSINGFLIPNGNTDAMVETLNLLINDTELRCRMSPKAADTARRYDLSRIADEWERCFQNLMKIK